MDPSTKEILLKFDEVGAYETPRSFNYNRLKRKVLDLQSSLAKRFKAAFQLDDQVQDASFHCDLMIPTELVASPNPHIGYSIRISNFGDLATLNFQEEITPEAQQDIISHLGQSGFVFIHYDDLEEPYDGSFDEFRKNVFADRPSWYTRYFDYL